MSNVVVQKKVVSYVPKVYMTAMRKKGYLLRGLSIMNMSEPTSFEKPGYLE